jgi:hypothetical protein
MNKSVISLRNLLLVNTALLEIAALLSCRNSIGDVYVALFTGLLAVAVYIDAFGRAHPSRFMLNSVSIAILAASILRMRVNNVIIVFSEAILLMTAVKMLEKKSSRDYCQIAALAVFTMVSVAIDVVTENSIYLGAVVSVLVGLQFILSTWFRHDPDAILTSREFLQTAGRSMTIWAMMIPLCLVFFFIAPRARLPLGQAQMNSMVGGEGTVGFSERVALGSVSSIQEINALAFRAEMPLIAPKYMFWRGFVLDIFDGREWAPGLRMHADKVSHQGEFTVQQDIFIENGGYMKPAFALDTPMMVDAQNVVYIGDGIFVNASFRNRLRRYSAVSALSDVLRPQTGTIQREHYLRLPDNFSPSIRKIAEEVTDGLDDAGKPDAIMRYLSPPDFSYTLTGLPVSENPLEEFMIRSKKGNCEYFATAMAVMLRMSGIPSRLVAGYRGGIYNDSGGYYVVNQSSAHVWVEAWNDAEGLWRRYDPTPASDEAGGGSYGAATYGFWWQYFDYINYNVSRIFMEYERESQSKLLDSMRHFIASPGQAVGEFIDKVYADKRKTGVVVWSVVIVCLAVAAVKLPRYIRERARRSRDEALRGRFLVAMRRRGFVKKPCDGLEDFSGMVLLKLGEGHSIARAASEFVEVFESYYFKDIPIEQAAFRRLEGLIRIIAARRGLGGRSA